MHCKQLFPKEVVKNVRCINVHPGFNPYNRGWYPQVFSILNKFPAGATIHEIDEYLDHGNIIVQKEVKIFAWDTSFTLYARVLQTEIELLSDNLQKILDISYTTIKPIREGNLNLKKDFKNLQTFELDQLTTGRELIDKMRALTHDNYRNLYFRDSETGKKVYIKITLEPEE